MTDLHPSEALELRHLRAEEARLAAQLDELKTRQQLAAEGLQDLRSMAEIARRMGCSESYVRALHDRAIMKLRHRLMQDGLTAADLRSPDSL